MRTNEERIAALHKRAAEIEREEHGRKMQFIQLTLTAACFMVIIALGIFIPDFAETLAPVSGTGNMNASILSENGALGYIVIGIIAFVLGAFVTIFCFKLKERQDTARHDGETDNDRKHI